MTGAEINSKNSDFGARIGTAPAEVEIHSRLGAQISPNV